MAHITVMPKLGFNMDVGTLVKWYKGEGDAVSKGEPLFAIETDKTTIDVEATESGTVKALFAKEGDAIPVTLPIAVIADPNEDASADIAACLKQLGRSETAPAASQPDPAAAEGPEPAKGAYDYDVVVIGGGPGGYVAAIKAAQLGKRTCIVEKDSFGGTCLNRGCIPTKTFIRSAEVLHEVKESAQFGVVSVDVSAAALDMGKVQQRKRSVVSGLVGGVEGLLRGNGVTALKGEAAITDCHTAVVGGKSVSAENLILATGSASKTLPIPVSNKMKVLTSTEALELTELPDRMVIIGGGVIGIEFASFFSAVGVHITVLEFMSEILPMVDEEIAQMATKAFHKKGVDVITGAKVSEIRDSEVVYEKDGQKFTVACDQVLMAVGRSPELCGIDCAKLGIKTERGAIVTDEKLRTSVPNIYAVGDVNGRSMLAHTASMEGVIAAEVICGRDVHMEYSAIPSCIYIEPEIASVGLTEAQARKKYGDVKVGKFPMMANGKAKVHGAPEGMIKIIVEPKYNGIVGAHLYCIHATDMIEELVVAMQLEGVADELVYAVHPHPTISEAVSEALHAAVDKAIHFM